MIKRNLRNITVISVAVCLLFAINSIVNLVWKYSIYPSSDLYNSFLPNDVINLFFGTPILIFSVIRALRGSRLGLIGWTGSLLFVLYNEIACLFAVRNIYSIIMDAFIVLLGLIAVVLMLTSLEYQKMLPPSEPVHRPKAYGSILIIMGLVFVVRAIINLVNFANNAVIMPLPDIGINIADLIICSLWIVSGILFFRKSATGCIMGLVSYFHASMLFIALMIFMVIQPVLCRTEFVMADFIVIMIMSLIFLVPFILLVRKAATDWVK